MKQAFVLSWVRGIEYEDYLVQFGTVGLIHAKVPVVLPVIACANVNTVKYHQCKCHHGERGK